MALQDFCQWLYDSALGNAVRESASLFPLMESIHVLALATVVGSISFVDLRLVGLTAKGRSVRQLVSDVLPVTWVAFLVAAASGAILFTSNAVEYFANFSFRMKMALLLLAGLNMLVFHLVTYRSVSQWDAAPQPPLAARIAGGTSLVLWVGIVAFGRWIGFTVGF